MKTALYLFVAIVAVAGSPALAQVSPAQLADTAFARADVNNDARLSRVEFDAAREALFRRADANGDNRLTVSELRAQRPEGSARPQRRPGREQLAQLRAIDRNNDRAIDITEFRATSDDRFARADANRDGFIQRHEIADLLALLGATR